jgi:IS30 family transposase
MGRTYKQLSLDDRCEIARLSANGGSVGQIAAALDRPPSTISRELRRNRGRQVGYKPSYAQQQTRARRWKGSRLERDASLRREVLAGLSRGWSPEQVAGRLARERGRRVISCESIYASSTPRSHARRTSPGGAICLGARASEATAANEAGAPQASSKAVFRWQNGLPRSPIAKSRATGKPI